MDKMPVVEEYVEEINEDNGINENDEDKEILNNDENEEDQPSPKIKMTKEEIFEVLSPRNKKVSQPPLKNDKNDKKDKIKEKKKRPPMSEEHKEKLRLAREKALETRRRNAQEKREMKELEKKAKQKKKEELKKYVNNEEDQEKPKEIIKEVKHPVSTITKKDLEEAQLEAIMKYEAMRKQRKKEKQEKEREQKEKDKLKQQINNMVKPNKVFYGQQGYFDNCF